MADLPIPFTGPMVRALLREIENPGTGKTQTRRVLKPQPPRFMHYGKDIMDWGLSGIYQDDDNAGTNRWWLDVQTDVDDNSHSEIKVAAAVGDRLYVREHWRTSGSLDSIAPRDLPRTAAVLYNADSDRPIWAGKHRQAMHMPKWASRITLIVTDVRVERLQDISPEDARDEGVERRSRKVRQMWLFGASAEERAAMYLRACVWEYEDLWNEINGPGAWEANPWVVAYSFRPILGNIDQIGGGHG